MEQLLADSMTEGSPVQDRRQRTAAEYWIPSRPQGRKAGRWEKLFGDSNMPGGCIAETKQRRDDSRCSSSEEELGRCLKALVAAAQNLLYCHKGIVLAHLGACRSRNN